MARPLPSHRKKRRSKRQHRILIPRRTDPPGDTPGLTEGSEHIPDADMQWMVYGPSGLKKDTAPTIEEIRKAPNHGVAWLNVDGVQDTGQVYQIGAHFNFHELALEDVNHVVQRPKVDVFDKHLFVVLRMASLGLDGEVVTEQVSLFLQKRLVVSFQERPGDCFDKLRHRIRTGGGRIQNRGADYLLYTLLDAIIDHYFPVLESLGDRLEFLEDEVLFKPRRALLNQIHGTRRELLMLRRAIWPLREAIDLLRREDTPGFTEETRLFLRDCSDHVVQLLDITETMRELCTSLLDAYMSSVSLRQNEIMQVLTVIATIFIPLTFITGLYGMNFNHDLSPWNMPELYTRWGYPIVILVMLLITAALLFYFWRQGWLGTRDTRPASEQSSKPQARF